MEGWIKLHRKFLEWEWFDTEHMVKLFLYLLLKANHKSGKWKGIDIERGQLITGLNSLSGDLNISVQTLRTCLMRLEKTGEINNQSTNKYRVLTICNYEEYQDNQQATNKLPNKQPTSNQQATNKQPTANKNNKKVNNKKNSINIEFELFWNLYDKKVGDKSKIEKKWMNLSDKNRTLAINHVKQYVLSTPDKQYRKNPETYLNQSGWESEIIKPTDQKKTETTGRNESQVIPEGYGEPSDTAITLQEYREKKEKETEK